MSGLADRALNRALLARQGLIERFDRPLVAVVEAIGALQAQAWSALPVALWTRMRSFSPGELYDALDRAELVWGIGIRGTLHLVSAREHPDYATVAAATTAGWHRAIKRTTPGMDALRAGMLEFASAAPVTNDQIREFAEAWIADHPGAIERREVEAQRSLKWRPIYRWSALIRAPAGGGWGPKAPADHRAAPVPPGSAAAPSQEHALERVALRHLAAFGPAAAEDVASWIGWPAPPLRRLLDGLDDALVSFEDRHGRRLYDLPDAPRPDADVPAPPRLLGAFDSTLLAYAARRRERIVPDALREAVYQKPNLQIRPTILVDGIVAGTWSVDVRRRDATLTLRPAGHIARGVRSALAAEAEALLAALHANARSRDVRFEL